MSYTKLKEVVVAVLFSSLSCSAQNSFTLRGQVIGPSMNTIYLHKSSLLSHSFQVVDSVRSSNQFFSFNQIIAEPTGYLLSMKNAPGQFLFIWDKDLVVYLRADDLNQSSVEESLVNDALKSFADTLETIYEKRFRAIRNELYQAKQGNDTTKIQQLHKDYYDIDIKYREAVISHIQLHSKSWASLFVLASYHKNLGRRVTLDLLSLMSESFQKSQLSCKLKQALNDPVYEISP